jgi:lysophospholipase L1-like esterase
MVKQYLNKFGLAILCSMGLLASSVAVQANADGRSNGQANERQWLGTWATAGSTRGLFDAPTVQLDDQTQRHVLRLSAGGKFLRVRLSNVNGTTPLTIGAATLARSRGEDQVQAGSIRTLTFNGEPSITIAPGARVFSDEVRLRVNPLADVTLSLYVPAGGASPDSPITTHVAALQTGYIGAGDQTASAEYATDSTFTSINYATGVDVAVSSYGLPPVGIVVLGDSIANGDQSTLDTNNRWPNLLAERLANKANGNGSGKGWHSDTGVMNLGISGNQVTKTLIGENAQARFDRDVVAQSGATHVIIHAGINDLGLPPFLNAIGVLPGAAATPESIISGLQQMIRRAHAQGLTAIGGTITPAAGFAIPTYGSPETEAARQAVNQWIRTSGAFDAVVDFDAVLRDPDEPTMLRSDLTDDFLHPNDAGYQAMADAVPLRLFQHARR